jgi:hypothetical protein
MSRTRLRGVIYAHIDEESRSEQPPLASSIARETHKQKPNRSVEPVNAASFHTAIAHASLRPHSASAAVSAHIPHRHEAHGPCAPGPSKPCGRNALPLPASSAAQRPAAGPSASVLALEPLALVAHRLARHALLDHQQHLARRPAAAGRRRALLSPPWGRRGSSAGAVLGLRAGPRLWLRLGRGRRGRLWGVGGHRAGKRRRAGLQRRGWLRRGAGLRLW